MGKFLGVGIINLLGIIIMVWIVTLLAKATVTQFRPPGLTETILAL